ncbi:MAG: helix-turn-helix transcriptional regulator [Lentisphaeria bacterium]|nr:helix-turn-helix transcriptional regulator [Lentisphaeria bacterium]
MDLNEFDYHNSFVPPESDIGLNMMLRWAGHQRTENKDYSFNGMRRGSQEFVLWQYTISGCGQIESDEGSFLIPPGCAFLLTIPDKHRYFLPSGHWEFLYLGFNGSEALRIARELRAKYSPVSSAFASPQAIAAAKMFLRRGMENDLSDPVETSELSYRFFMDMIRTCRPDAGDAGKDPVMLFHQFCVQHLAKPLQVEDMAEFAGYSRSHFCRIFRGRTGKSPHKYFLELRMRMALRMLQSGNLSVKETAAACGFPDNSYFCKVFYRFYHTNPSAFLSRKK